jgi:hypothetical protein
MSFRVPFTKPVGHNLYTTPVVTFFRLLRSAPKIARGHDFLPDNAEANGGRAAKPAPFWPGQLAGRHIKIGAAVNPRSAGQPYDRSFVLNPTA